jgi:hypothetical protein
MLTNWLEATTKPNHEMLTNLRRERLKYKTHCVGKLQFLTLNEIAHIVIIMH